MEATVKPAAKRVQVTLLRPSGGDAIPTIELFLEDFADATPQGLESLVFALAFRQQVDCCSCLKSARVKWALVGST